MSIKIYNLALDHLNEEPILSTDDDTAVVKWLSRNYPIVRDGLLRAHPWNFALRLGSIAKDEAAPAFGWLYQYTLPNDCVRVLPVTLNGARNGASIRYEIIGKKIQTDATSPLKVRYISNDVDQDDFDASFTELFGITLALRMAQWLTGKQSYVERLKQEAMGLMNNAQLIDALEGTPENTEASDWVSGRITGVLE